MSNNFERRLFIGDKDHTPNKGEGSEVLSKEIFDELIEKKEIFPDAQERFEATLEANGYEQVRELENGMQYPSLTQWLEVQLAENGGVRMYPAFIKNTMSGEIHFCKARIRPKKENWGGLEKEAEVLQRLPKEMPVPQFISYIPEHKENGQLELLITEAIKFDNARVLPLEEWTPEYVQNAFVQIKELEKIPIKNLPELSQEPEVTIQSVLERLDDVLEPSFRNTIEEILTAYQPYAEPILVHGDTWLKNILVSTNPDNPQTIFVDWERGGAGYRGQDAGRTWWQLWYNEEIRQAPIEPYLNEQDPSARAARSTQLRFGVVFEAMRWLSAASDDIKNNTDSEKEPELLSRITDIQEKATAMLASVQ